MGLKSLFSENKSEVKDVMYLVALQGLNFVAPLVVLPYLMKVLDATNFGYIGFSLAVCQYLQLIVDFGFNLSATKRIALVRDNKEEVNRIFSATFFSKMLLLALSAVLLVAVSFIPRFAVYRPTLYIMFLTVIGNAFLFVFLFQGIGQVKWVSIGNAIAKFALLPLTFVFVKKPDDVLIAAVLQASVSVLAAIFTIGLTAHNRWASLVQVSWTQIRNEMRESWPIFLSSAAINVYTACFIVFLGWFASAGEVGRYSAADRVMRALCYAVIMPVLQAFYPKVSRMAADARAEAVRLNRQLLGVVMAGMTCVWAALFFGGPWIEYWLQGNYVGTSTLFRIDAFVPLFVGVGGVFGQLYLLALGGSRQKKQFEGVYLAVAVIAIVAVLALTPVLGARGTALALLVTEASVALLFTLFASKMTHGI
ncbi:MAG: oligosaccharide flippase family protein [Paludibacteraceae bacterium]|nr:oligosaccharide flippase family protein [Paludibacteraceae bacterium]